MSGGSSAAESRSPKDTQKRVLSGPNSVPICPPSPPMTFPRRQACSTHSSGNRTSSQPASTNEPYPAYASAGSDQRGDVCSEHW
jgi:hypothetical protein